MTFDELDRRFAELRLQHRAGALSLEDFEARRKDLMAQDDQGRWWTKDADTGGWVHHDGSAWVAGTPAGYVPANPAPAPAPYPYQGPTPGSSASGRTAFSGGPGPVAVPGPSMGQGLAIVLYIAAFFVPLVGWVMFFVNRTKPLEADRNVAKIAGIVATAGFVLWMLLSLA